MRLACGPSQAPILGDCDTWFVGRIVDRFAAGDHDAFLLEPLEAAAGASRSVFRLDQAKAIDPGHPAWWRRCGQRCPRQYHPRAVDSYPT